MRSKFAYIRPRKLSEALELLELHKAEAKVSAGMTDLMAEIKDGRLTSSLLIDINRLDELNFIHDAGDHIRIGPLATHAELAASQLIRENIPVLAESAGHLGSPQIRNIGTLGGNISNASPCADTLPALTVLEAEVILKSRRGQRTLPITDFYLGPYQTVLSPDEMLTEIFIPKMNRRWQMTYHKVARRKALAPSRLSLAVQGMVEKDTITAIRISVGACTPTPSRAREAEEFLNGRVLSTANLQKTAQLTTQGVLRRTGLRHSSLYKKPVIESLMLKALKEVFRQG